MKKRIAIILLAFAAIPAFAQTLTLRQCMDEAQKNWPTSKRYGLVEASRDFTIANAATGWLPQVSVSASAYGFTDIVEETIDMDNYLAAATVSLNQQIYDGGSVASSKRITRAQAEVESRQLDVTVYDVYDRTIQVFFGILLIDERIRQNAILQSDLDVSLKSVNSMIGGGLANESDRDAVLVQQEKARQQLDGLQASRQAYIKMLGLLTGLKCDNSTVLVRPTLDFSSATRPELRFYDAQESLLDEQRKRLDINLRPTLSATLMGTLHTKVSDLAKTNTLLGGLTLKWNIGALYTRKNDIRKLDLERDKIAADRETFLLANSIEQESSNGNIESLKKQIAHDAEIVMLQERVLAKMRLKTEQGTESVNELMRSTNAADDARQQKALHEIQLLKEQFNLNYIKGL